MEEKQGVLEEEDHTRLFDFTEESSRRADRTSIFEKVNLVQPNNQ